MSRKSIAIVAGVGSLALLAGAVLFYSRRLDRSSRAKGQTLPYYRRTGFLSKFLQESNAGPRGVESIHVPDGFEVEQVAGPDLVNYPMFIAYDDRGRLFVCESAGRNVSDEDMQAKPEMRIRLLEDSNGDGVFDRKDFRGQDQHDDGALWYRGSLYVSPDFRFDDTNPTALLIIAK